MTDDAVPPEVELDFRTPDELWSGVDANAVSIWHSPYEFTLDWAVAGPVEIDDPDDPASLLRVRAIVVTRVRIPVGLVFDVLQGLSQVMTDYERLYGEIRRPGEG